MILRFLGLAFLILVFITASDPFFGTDFMLKPPPEEEPSDVRDLQWRATDALTSYLSDPDDRVSDEFVVTSYYAPTVKFWFFIYTKFESNQVVFHDKNDLSLIYRILDFSSLHEKKLPKNTLYILQKKISTEKLSEMREQFEALAQNPYSLEPWAKDVYESILRTGREIPVAEPERKAFFKDLASGLRTQTGQRDFIREGLVRSLPYQNFLSKYFEAKGLPKELLAIPFLESSFNPRAHSKVNALGVWQFMPLIASYFVPKRTNHIDYRSNVGVSSVSAAFLMGENYKILKSWDLAVTAYNSGPKHLLKTKRELASAKVDLEKVIKHSDSRHFGFASKNFYSEFLALAHTLAYEEEIFKDLHGHDRPDVDLDLQFYLTKCRLSLAKTLTPEQLDDVAFHNNQIRDFERVYPRGLILTSKSELPESKFHRLAFDQILKTKPIKWEKLLKGQSCSTR